MNFGLHVLVLLFLLLVSFSTCLLLMVIQHLSISAPLSRKHRRCPSCWLYDCMIWARASQESPTLSAASFSLRGVHRSVNWPRSIVNGAGGDVAERLKILLQAQEEAHSRRPTLQIDVTTQQEREFHERQRHGRHCANIVQISSS